MTSAVNRLAAKLAGIPVEAYWREGENGLEFVVAHERGGIDVEIAPDGYPIDHALRKYPITHFESRECTRCGGTGEFSYNQMHGTMCYGCSGNGRQLTKKGAEGYQMWQQSKRAAKEVLAKDAQVGDVIAVNSVEDPNERVWATIARIEPTDRPSGWSGAGDDRKVTSYFQRIEFTRGGELYKVEELVNGQSILTRKPKPGSVLDPATLPGYVGFKPTGWLITPKARRR